MKGMSKAAPISFGGNEMGAYDHKSPSGSDDDITKIGALSDGFANTATNDTSVEDSNVGAANGNNRNNDNSDNSTNTDIDAKVDVAVGNGDNRDNEYDWSYDSKTVSLSDNDTNTKTTTITDTDTKVDYDWSYDSKTVSMSDNDTNIKTTTVTDTDIKNISDDDTTNTSGSFNSSESFYKSDTDFAVLDDVKDFGNLGIAGGDLTFNLGDDFSFTLDVDNVLNSSLNGGSHNTGFSLVQANHLADQDVAYDVKMNNGGAENHLKADAGTAYGAEGVDMDGKGWDLKAGDDVAGTSTADASAILANSGFHMELVQGANMLSNAVDVSIIGGNSHITDVGEDTSSH
jgi:hypothetical protein